MRKPGPVKAHSFLRLNVPCGWERSGEMLATGVLAMGLGPPLARYGLSGQPRLSSPVPSFPPFPELPALGVSGGHGVGGSNRIC